VVASLDQGVKALVVRLLPPDASIPLVPGVLFLTHVRNTGVAFGLLSGIPPAVIVLVALTVVFLVTYNEGRRLHDRWSRVAGGLLLGGAAGNLGDRIRLGYVVDYLDLRIWPVFNLADTAVVCGSAILLLALLRRNRGEG
jgi:signal peptidase II